MVLLRISKEQNFVTQSSGQIRLIYFQFGALKSKAYQIKVVIDLPLHIPWKAEFHKSKVEVTFLFFHLEQCKWTVPDHSRSFL